MDKGRIVAEIPRGEVSSDAVRRHLSI